MKPHVALRHGNASFLDAPVSGGVEGARDGTLAIMVGGPEAAFDRAQPVFKALGRTATRFGDNGAGQAAKATNQIMCAGIIQAVAEAMAFAKAEGLPLLPLIETLGQGAGSSWYFVHRAPNMVRNAYPAGFRVRLHEKDLKICRDMAARHGVALPVVETTLADYRGLIDQGHGDEDISTIFRLKDALFASRRHRGGRPAGPMSAQPPSPPAAGHDRPLYLPDFCEARAVLAVVLIAALLALVLALARHSAGGSFWTDLARTSAYLLWAGLLCAGVLCKARPWLAKQAPRRATVGALALMVGTVALVSEAVYWFGVFWAGRLGIASSVFPASHAAFVLPNLLIAAIVGALTLRYFYVTGEWRRSVELEARARIRALQARIRPHFLFNSMNTIAALTRSDPVRAEEAIEDLADLFRFNLRDAQGQISLREELEVARIYQRIEQLRLGDRLQVRWKVGDLPARAQVPSLLLQPLLENAIGHGVEPLPEGGTVVVQGRTVDETVEIEVSNPVPPERRPARSGHRIALDNIRQRLDLAYPGRSSVEVVDAGDNYCVRLRFPLVLGEAAGPP